MKWGLFLHNELMAEYAGTAEGCIEAMDDADFAYQETGVPHEVKRFDYVEVEAK